MKKLKMLALAFITMIMCTFSVNAAEITFAENSSGGNITINPAKTTYKYQWVHVDYSAYTAVEAKLKGISGEIKTLAADYNAKAAKTREAATAYNNATTSADKKAKWEAYEIAKNASDAAKVTVDNKYNEFFSEIARIAPRTSNWKNVTSGTIAFDKGGIDYAQADAAVIWVSTGNATHPYEAKIYMYQEADGSLRAEVDCPVVKKYCEIVDGNYYGHDGTKVSKEQYENECLPKICKKDGDKFYGLDGTEVNESIYKEQCENPSCGIKNGKYYDDEGKEVTEPEYNKACNSCKVDGDKYYDKDGKEVTEEEYNKSCNVCRVDNGKYYDKDGKEVTEEEYNKSCNPTCKVEDGKYYDKDGKEVTKEEYNKSCNVCKVEDGKYYDKDGKEVTKEEYNKSCNVCRVEDGKYYGPDGKEIDKEKYEEICPANPKTGFGLPLTLGIIIIGGGTAAIMVANKKKLFKQI